MSFQIPEPPSEAAEYFYNLVVANYGQVGDSYSASMRFFARLPGFCMMREVDMHVNGNDMFTVVNVFIATPIYIPHSVTAQHSEWVRSGLSVRKPHDEFSVLTGTYKALKRACTTSIYCKDPEEKELWNAVYRSARVIRHFLAEDPDGRVIIQAAVPTFNPFAPIDHD